MKNYLTLLHFEDREDLLEGMVMLQRHNIVIHEIYAPEPMPGIETKVRINQLRFGEAIFRFGCVGGMGLTALGYLIGQHTDWKSVMTNILFLLITLLIANRLFSVTAPKIILQPGDRRYLVVVDTQRIPVNESIAHLFQYACAVELSPAIKNIVIS